MWSGFDYGGEPHDNDWPGVHCNYGIMDRACLPKDSYYYYQSWWSEEIVLYVFPHWNWRGSEGQDIPVWCYSNCEEVELLVNASVIITGLLKKAISLKLKAVVFFVGLEMKKCPLNLSRNWHPVAKFCLKRGLNGRCRLLIKKWPNLL